MSVPSMTAYSVVVGPPGSGLAPISGLSTSELPVSPSGVLLPHKRLDMWVLASGCTLHAYLPVTLVRRHPFPRSSSSVAATA